MISVSAVEEFLHRVEDVAEGPPPAAHAPAGHTPVTAIAEQWQKLGIRPGEVVMLCLPNGKGLLEQFFGILLAGGVPALVSPNTPSARIHELIAAIGAGAIGQVRARPGDHSTAIGAVHAHRLHRDGPPAAATGEVVLLTSGTSGFASGCVFDFGQLMLNAERHAQAIGQETGDTVLINLPLHFSFALVAQALASFVRRNRLIISGPPFHTPSYLRTLAKHEVTISSLTPILVRSMKEHFAPPGTLRVLTVGGDQLAAREVEHLLRLRPQGQLYITYGLTQAGPRVSTLAAHAEPARRFASVGRPHPGVTAALHDLNDGSRMKQLYIASATTLKRKIGLIEGVPVAGQTSDRSIATGDVFEEDGEGYLYFHGRISDYIVRNGEKICLAAIRRVAMGCPNVLRARTVVSRHDYGEDFDLVLDLADGAADASSDLLRKWLRRSEMPRSIQVARSEAAPVAGYK